MLSFDKMLSEFQELSAFSKNVKSWRFAELFGKFCMPKNVRETNLRSIGTLSMARALRRRPVHQYRSIDVLEELEAGAVRFRPARPAGGRHRRRGRRGSAAPAAAGADALAALSAAVAGGGA